MRRYSLQQMRREYAGEWKLIRIFLLSFLALSVILCWILYIARKDHTLRDIWFFASLPLGVGLFVLGLSLVLGGENRLLRRTPYGKALSALGDARAAMAQIDAEAPGAAFLSHAALMRHWLILYSAAPTKWDPQRQCARPLPVKEIESVAFSRNKTGVEISVRGRDGRVTRADLNGREEWDVFLQWLRTQEIEATWSN